MSVKLESRPEARLLSPVAATRTPSARMRWKTRKLVMEREIYT